MKDFRSCKSSKTILNSRINKKIFQKQENENILVEYFLPAFYEEKTSIFLQIIKTKNQPTWKK
ncbi:MAG TPA: hypothetical protein DCQ93_00195 [Bacteroidetes bacterium]|nr:hypothetical protein [Bacteroidota bacterium]